MKHPQLTLSAVVVATLFAAASAQAGVSTAEAAKLKGELSPVGAEKAGN
jgi:hypothetical protein